MFTLYNDKTVLFKQQQHFVSICANTFLVSRTKFWLCQQQIYILSIHNCTSENLTNDGKRKCCTTLNNKTTTPYLCIRKDFASLFQFVVISSTSLLLALVKKKKLKKID